MDLAKKIRKTYDKCRTDRRSWETLWQDCADFFDPSRSDFIGNNQQGQENREKIFDSVGEDALENLVAYLMSILVNPSVQWFKIAPIDDEQVSDPMDLKFLEMAEKKMLAAFNSENTGFLLSTYNFLKELCTYGSSCQFEDEEEGEIRFLTPSLAQIYFKENSRGRIDTVYRCFQLTASQILEKFDIDAIPGKIQTASDNNNETKFKIVHAVYPRNKDEVIENALDPKAFPIASVYLLLDGDVILEESGYMEMPFFPTRYTKTAGETYGRGPGLKALPDVRVNNEINRSLLIAAEKQSDPPTLVPDDGFLSEIGTNGGDITTYRSNTPMKDKIITLSSQANLSAMFEIIAQKQQAIRKMFLNDKIQMNGGPQKTATEVLQIEDEKMRLLGPLSSRLAVEWLEPLITRTFAIMARRGDFGEIPESLGGKDLQVQYVSPITRAQKQTESTAFLTALGNVQPLLQMRPDLMENFDLDTFVRDLPQMFGFSETYLVAQEVIEQQRQAKAEEAQRQQQMMEQSAQLQDAKTASEIGDKLSEI